MLLMLIYWSRNIPLQRPLSQQRFGFIHIHLLTMPHTKKKSPEEVKQMIQTITKENDQEIKNTELDLSFQKLESERLNLETFRQKLDNKKSEYGVLSM